MRLALLAVLVAVPRIAEAFCGFYVAGSGDKLTNDATQVVLMRSGTRTVLAMQNHYKGPPDAFAMVVPVPVVLQQADVKTLAPEVFDRIDTMDSPRLVEYWEHDPCAPEPAPNDPASLARPTEQAPDTNTAVKIEAKFAVGEYQIVILSATDSTSLTTWLEQQKYKIPAGAEPLLRPYVEAGMKFFVAKVDPAKVKWVGEGNDKRAELSPLRFHYDSEEFALPIRLGLANSSGKQDLIVHILAPHQRYEVANYDNIRIPTNIEVREAVKGRFAEFYTALYDRTVEKHPRAVVTEYAWDAGSCDPCPGPVLDQNDFLTLGADVLEGTRAKPQAYAAADFVLTRLHARYGKDLSDDLRFKAADPIAGGRELPGGQPEEGSQPAPINNFQGRYILRHRWLGPLTCEKPVRGRWGGPEGGASPVSQPVKNAAFAKRGTAGDLAAAIVSATASAPQAVPASGATRTTTSSGCCQGSSDSGGLVSSLGLALWLVTRRRPGLARRR